MGDTKGIGTDGLKTLPYITRPFTSRSSFGAQVFLFFPHTLILLYRKVVADHLRHTAQKQNEGENWDSEQTFHFL